VGERARRARREEAAELAVALAGELLRDEMEPGDDARLVQEYTDRVGRNGGSA
jgi:F0F1-type ATP synthase membrane subunit b/b'